MDNYVLLQKHFSRLTHLTNYANMQNYIPVTISKGCQSVQVRLTPKHTSKGYGYKHTCPKMGIK